MFSEPVLICQNLSILKDGAAPGSRVLLRGGPGIAEARMSTAHEPLVLTEMQKGKLKSMFFSSLNHFGIMSYKILVKPVPSSILCGQHLSFLKCLLLTLCEATGSWDAFQSTFYFFPLPIIFHDGKS